MVEIGDRIKRPFNRCRKAPGGSIEVNSTPGKGAELILDSQQSSER